MPICLTRWLAETSAWASTSRAADARGRFVAADRVDAARRENHFRFSQFARDLGVGRWPNMSLSQVGERKRFLHRAVHHGEVGEGEKLGQDHLADVVEGAGGVLEAGALQVERVVEKVHHDADGNLVAPERRPVEGGRLRVLVIEGEEGDGEVARALEAERLERIGGGSSFGGARRRPPG